MAYTRVATKEVINVNSDFYKNTIFYAFINGEIYQAKIHSMIFAIGSKNVFENMATKLCTINDIVVEFAGLGKKQWHMGTHKYDNCFIPKEMQLYATLDECKKSVNPIFKISSNYAVSDYIVRESLTLNKPIVLHLYLITPKNSVWVSNGQTYSNGSKGFNLMGYKWNGITAEKVRYTFGKDEICTNERVLANLYRLPCYDCISDEWVITNNSLYGSKEECIKDNSVIVHTFEECVHKF